MRKLLVASLVLGITGGLTVLGVNSAFAAGEQPSASTSAKKDISKAIEHAQEAEKAGEKGSAADLVKHAEVALKIAKEAQTTMHTEHLNDAVNALDEAVKHGKKGETKDATHHAKRAIEKLQEAEK